ncbi:IST1-like protein [Ananas comosus]|uniref:IST1-like protein n=1 Tax=Ananas comosus TaxID=4615 RepID=A0A199VRN0_ANACO|nr:IST1-like protein [Ananas comosus]
MGRKLDLLLGRTSRQTAKLKTLLGLAVSRLAVLRNQRQARCAVARGDVAELVRLGRLDHALLRVRLSMPPQILFFLVEQVIREQNMLDAFVMMESYCHLVTERAALLNHQKTCPEELREAVASLIFAASRCGDLPELNDVRHIFVAKFGKDFVSAAVDLRNNCGVNPKMIQKLSTRQPSLESRQRVTKEIAAEKGIKVEFFDEPASTVSEGENEIRPSIIDRKLSELDLDNSLLVEAAKKYADVEAAAQAAFESATFAAAAARAAVVLSKSESQGKGSGDWRNNTSTNYSKTDESFEKLQEGELSPKEKGLLHKGLGEKFVAEHFSRSSSSSSSGDSVEIHYKETSMSSKASEGHKGKEKFLFNTSNDNAEKNQSFKSTERFETKQQVSYLRPPYRRGDQVRYKDHGHYENSSKDEEIGNKMDELNKELRRQPASVRTRRAL